MEQIKLANILSIICKQSLLGSLWSVPDDSMTAGKLSVLIRNLVCR